MAESTATKAHRQRRGDGTIYATKDGRLRAAITVPHPVTGEPIRRYLSGRTDAEVRRKLRETRDLAATIGRTPTVASWTERWLATVAHRIRPATLAGYRTAIRQHVIPTLGRHELARLRPSDVEAMTGAMIDRGRAGSTAALARRVLVIALSDAARDGLVARNVARLARPPRTAEPVRRALSAPEVRRFLAAIEGEELEPLVSLALATGLRRGELLALRWSDVDGSMLTVSRALARAAGGGYAVAEPKTRRGRRTIALPALATAALARQRERQDVERAAAGSAWQDRTGLVFADPAGRPWHPETITSMYGALVVRSGIGHLRLHDLRHSAATLALSAGVPVRDVSDALGHASPSITLDIYGQTVAEGPRRVADAMDRALGG